MLSLDIPTEYRGGDETILLCRSTVVLPAVLTLRELIRLKVAQDVHAFNERKAEAYGCEYLNPADLARAQEEGRRMLGDPLNKGKIDPVMEARLAVAAFADGAFKVELEGERLTRLEERVELEPLSDLRFVRLLPLK